MKLALFELALCLAMIITGTTNTLTTKCADRCESVGSDGQLHAFKHPFVQPLGMFVGMTFCLAIYHLQRYFSSCSATKSADLSAAADFTTQFPKSVFIAPAFSDLIAMSLMYFGLTQTTASVYQMLRGSSVIFTALLTKFFLRNKVFFFQHWAGIVTVALGGAVVGWASVIHPTDSGDTSGDYVLWGDVAVIVAQVFVAAQAVLEELYVKRYNVQPLLAAGWEGVWGTALTIVILVPLYFIPGPEAGNRMENPYDALVQFSNSTPLLLCALGNMISVACFNYFAVSVTKYFSSTTRMIVDATRTVVIWGISMALGWEFFFYLELIGYLILLLGLILYRELLRIPCGNYLATATTTTANSNAQSDKADVPYVILQPDTPLLNINAVSTQLNVEAQQSYQNGTSFISRK